MRGGTTKTASELNRRERRFLEVHNSLLDVGRDLIAELGEEDVTIKMVADDADVAQTTFYGHFESRDQFVQAVRERWIERVSAALMANVPHDAPPYIRVAAMTRSLLSVVETNSPGVRYGLMLLDARGAPEDPIDMLLDEMIEDGIRVGVFVNLRDRALGKAMLLGALRLGLGFALGRPQTVPEIGDQVVRHVLGVIGTPQALVDDAIEVGR